MLRQVKNPFLCKEAVIDKTSACCRDGNSSTRPENYSFPLGNKERIYDPNPSRKAKRGVFHNDNTWNLSGSLKDAATDGALNIYSTLMMCYEHFVIQSA